MKTGVQPSARGRLWRCTAVSLLLHAALALPWLAANWLKTATPHPPQPLALDVLGMLGTRQLEKQTIKAAPAKVSVQPQPRADVRPAPHPAPHLARLPDDVASPATAAVTQAADAAPKPQQPTPPAPARAPVPDDGAERQQVQQTIQPPESEATLTRRYVIAMSLAIQSRLVYPAEARDAGHVGRPTIRFTVTEDGDILPGTLAIGNSSGYRLLDDYALRAARAGAPFGRPPRRMEVVIAVSFTAS